MHRLLSVRLCQLLEQKSLEKMPLEKKSLEKNHISATVQLRVMGQGQRSHGSRSKVRWVKTGLKVMILAGGLTPTSCCIFFTNKDIHHFHHFRL